MANEGQQDRYTHGYDTRFVERLQSRTVERAAAFFLPHLQPGMTLLDCGCGPGSITVGLAEVVAPGEVVGIDIETSQVETARSHAREREVQNVRFEVGSVFELPFPDASFDAAFAHTLLQHLNQPMKALSEIHRVLKPGGIIGIKEDDQGSVILAPFDPGMERFFDLFQRVWKHDGGDPFLARRHRELLRLTGFTKIEASASSVYEGTPEATLRTSEAWARLVPTFGETAIQQGWTDSKEIEEIVAACKAWGKHPDAFVTFLHCEAVGWKE